MGIGYLAEARRGAFQVVGWQALVAFLAGVVGLLVGDFKTGEAAFLGGMTVTAANLILTVGVFGGRVARDPQLFLMRLVLGEMLKFVAMMVLFAVAIVVFKAAFAPMMLGFAAALVAHLIGLLKSNIGQIQ